jgi:diaminopimelate epimerase
MIETHPQFPAKTNVEFTTPIDAQTYQVTVWERGCGFTHACGTGACATAVAAIASGRADAKRPVEIRLPGGILKIEWAGDYNAPVIMTGPAATTCVGVLDARFAQVFQTVQGTATHA